jgi:hypothetical protein
MPVLLQTRVEAETDVLPLAEELAACSSSPISRSPFPAPGPFGLRAAAPVTSASGSKRRWPPATAGSTAWEVRRKRSGVPPSTLESHIGRLRIDKLAFRPRPPGR